MTYDIHIHACNLQLTIVACFTIIAVEQCIFLPLDICVDLRLTVGTGHTSTVPSSPPASTQVSSGSISAQRRAARGGGVSTISSRHICKVAVHHNQTRSGLHVTTKRPSRPPQLTLLKASAAGAAASSVPFSAHVCSHALTRCDSVPGAHGPIAECATM